MSEALRALADASDAQFDAPPGGMPSEDTSATGVEITPEAPETPETPQPPQKAGDEAEGEPEAKTKGKELSKYELAKRKDERERKQKESEKRRVDSAFAKAAAAEKEKEQLVKQLNEQNQRLAAMEQQNRINSDPILKQANDLLQKRYAPEDLEAEAVRLDASGDHDGASAARAIARQMQNIVQDWQAQQQQSQQQQSQTSWRQHQYGTEDFDRAAATLQQGTQEWMDCWATCESNLVAQREKSQDPWDRECAKQFRDKNSEFGKRLQYFLSQTAFGRAMSKHAEGILPAFDIVKMSMIIDTQRAQLTKLNKEVNQLRGYTSPGGSAPVNGANGHANGFNPRAAAFERDTSGRLTRSGEEAFRRLSPDQMREFIRARETE